MLHDSEFVTSEKVICHWNLSRMHSLIIFVQKS